MYFAPDDFGATPDDFRRVRRAMRNEGYGSWVLVEMQEAQTYHEIVAPLSITEFEQYLHGTARLQVALGKMNGYRFDKKLTRFNDIVDCAFRYGRAGEVFAKGPALCGLMEAVEACSPDIEDMYVEGRGPAAMCEEWLLSVPDPRA